MKGVITTRHLLTHAPVIIAEFGLVSYLRCVIKMMLARDESTFLQCMLRLK